jgi:tetratricopeptide (TPR) repeat protein
MPPAGVDLEPETVIDISHESLIRNWLRLKDWVNEEAQSARIYRRLAEAAVLHREGSEGLLQDPGLQIALDWRHKANPNAAWARRYHPDFDEALRYLDDSRAARDAAVAERERQREEQIARERRELEQAQLYAEQQRRAARRLRYLSFGMAVMFLLALATAAFAFSARRQARQSERVALGLRDEALKQQSYIASLLEREKGEKQKARDAEDSAEKQATIAGDEREKADIARLEAVKALAKAQQQTELANTEKSKAQAQTQIAIKQTELVQQEVKKNQRAREANDYFRDGVAYAQRGDYDNAGILLTQAIEGYEDPLVSNKEAVADAETQAGNFMFNIAYARFIQENGNLDETAMHDVQFFKTSFDRAASVYAEAPVNSPQKAAAALFTLGTMLLKLTKDEFGGDGRNRAALAELIEASSLDRPVPKLGFFSDRAGGKLPQQSDFSRKGKAEIEEQAVERYQKALEYYRKAGNYEGETKTAFQLGDFYMKKANTIASGHGDLSLISPSRQKAIYYFEQLMNPNATGPDPSRVRLLVWLGGLQQQLGNQPAADRYFGRAIETYQRDASWAKGGLAEIASIAEEVGQTDVAALYYAKAVAAFEAEGNLPLQAKALYSLGRVHEKLQDPGAFDKAIQYYRKAVRTTARAMEANKEATGELDELLRIGALAESIGDYQLALEAYELTITSVGDSQADWRLLRAARAHSEIGSVFAETNKPMQALESYKRSQEIYTGLLKDSDAETKNEAKIEMQRLRKIITALLQTVPTK